jgi:N-acetyltransferase
MAMLDVPTLEGERVRLEPLSVGHHGDLCSVGLDERIWRWVQPRVRTGEDMRAYIETALRSRAAGTALPLATIDKQSGRAIGSTRFGNIDLVNRHVEIGWTWVGVDWQRTHVNTEAKYLMLRYAFETMGCLRVEFKTDVRNELSRGALVRLGATFEGVARRHMVLADGSVRDSAWFSVVDGEWAGLREKLEARLAR